MKGHHIPYKGTWSGHSTKSQLQISILPLIWGHPANQDTMGVPLLHNTFIQVPSDPGPVTVLTKEIHHLLISLIVFTDLQCL